MGTWKPDDYRLHLSAMPDPKLAEQLFDLAWRFDFSAPGFCVLEVGPGAESHTLRSWMVGLKERLTEVAVSRGGKPFLFRSMGRFDQQETTKFHLDGAPAESMLMLGYEPSQVQSRLFLGDYRDERRLWNSASWRIRELLDSNELLEEGRNMKHCVGRYSARCARGLSTIWSLTCSDSQSQCRRELTIEVKPKDRRVVQAKGLGNSMPTPEARRIICFG